MPTLACIILPLLHPASKDLLWFYVIYVESHIVIQAVYDCLFIDLHIIPLCQFSIFQYNILVVANYIITSLAKEAIFLVALVSLSVCLFVCLSVDNILLTKLWTNWDEILWTGPE